MGQIRVLVVDDSPLARDVITKILEKDPDFSIVGHAENGADAIRMTQNLRPDLIIMDLYMPVLDGFQAIEEIMAFTPTPILVSTTALAREGKSISFRALELGALDVIDKPVLSPGKTPNPHESNIIHLSKMLSKVKVVSHVRGKRKKPPPQEAVIKPASGQLCLIAIAASTGGPKALLQIFQGLTPDLPAAIVVVQHISDGFSRGLANWLNHETKLTVKEGVAGDTLTSGTAYIAPTGKHMIVKGTGTVALTSDPPLMGHRPSGNILLRSAADIYGTNCIGVILTGMGNDGAEGIYAIKKNGGRTIAQNEKDCVVFGMPKAAIELGAIDLVSPLDSISAELIKMLSLPLER